MATILHTTYSNAFKWELLNFEWRFIEIHPFGSTLEYVSIGADNGLVPNRQQIIFWPNDDPVHWPIHASPGPIELNQIR